MADPIYAQRYRHLKRLAPGRDEAAYRAQDDAGRPVVISVVRPFDPSGFLRTMGLVSAVRHLDLTAVLDAGRDGADCFVVSDDPGGADAQAPGISARRRWRGAPRRPPPTASSSP